MKLRIALILAGCVAVGVAGAEEYIGLPWRLTPSPDGASCLYVAEHRLDGASAYTLTVMVRSVSGIPRLKYSLTPRHGPAVQSPSGAAIAYRAYDYTRKGPVYIYGTGVRWPHPYPALSLSAEAVGDDIRWSSDGTHLRLRGRRGLSQVFTVSGAMVNDTKARKLKIKWAKRVRPEVLPAFMTQRQPVVSPGMPILWGRDGKTVYVADQEGVWRATLGDPFMAVWDLILEAVNVRSLAMAPSGKFLVGEAGLEEQRDLWELHFEADAVEKRVVGEGWGVAFLPDEDVYYYAKHEGLHVVRGPEDDRFIHAVPWHHKRF